MNKFIGILSCLALCGVLFAGLYGIDRINDRAADGQKNNADTTSTTHSVNEFCSDLPFVIINTNGDAIEKSIAIWCGITVIDNAEGKNYLSDTPDFTTDATIHYRGNSSFNFDKKQYRLEFFQSRDANAKERNIAVMGMQAESDWVLNGPYQDKALMRNKLTYDIARECMEWAPDTRYCEVFVNGGYMGVYVMTESVKVSKDRINLSDYALLGGKTPYLVLRERSFVETRNPITTFGTPAAKTDKTLFVVYPKALTLTNTQKGWIEDDISVFERALYSESFDDPEKGYMQYIDLDSFAAYYVINEMAVNEDAGYHSTYCYKDFDGKLKMGPVWDFNSAYDNYVDFKTHTNQFYLNDNNWFTRLTQDKAFVNAVIEKYRDLRQGILSYESFCARIDANVETLGDAANRNFEKWGYTFSEEMLNSDETGADRDIHSFEDAIVQLKRYIRDRGDYLDKNIEKLYLYCTNR